MPREPVERLRAQRIARDLEASGDSVAAETVRLMRKHS
jgi:hypothetical protein